MSSLSLALCLLLALASVSGQSYTTKFDNVNVDQILKNDRLVNNYINCLLDKGKCTADGAEIKRLIPDALHSRCNKCSAWQRNSSDKILRHLISRKPQAFKQLEQKYDPSGYYRQAYNADAARRGIRL